MAKERMITRTIDTWAIDVLCACMNDGAAPVLETLTATIPGHIKEADISRYLATEWSTESIIFVKALGTPVKVSTLYGMPEAKFMLFAEKLER